MLQIDQILGQVLRHLLGERRHQDALAVFRPAADLFDQVVDLAFGRLDRDLRVDQARRPDDLLDGLGAVFFLVGPGRRGDENDLTDPLLELREFQGPVVPSRGQTEPVFDERVFARLVAVVHRPDLRQSLMRLVHHEQPVFREVF